MFYYTIKMLFGVFRTCRRRAWRSRVLMLPSQTLTLIETTHSSLVISSVFHTGKEGHVSLLGIERAPRQAAYFLSVKFQVIQLQRKTKAYGHVIEPFFFFFIMFAQCSRTQNTHIQVHTYTHTHTHTHTRSCAEFPQNWKSQLARK